MPPSIFFFQHLSTRKIVESGNASHSALFTGHTSKTCINAHDNTATAKVPMKRATSYWYMEAKTQNILVYGG